MSKNSDREKIRAVRARQRALGRELRRVYDDVAHAPLPDEFVELLRKIDDSAALSAGAERNKKPQ